MPELVVGETVRTREPVLRVDNRFAPGSYVFRLVVIDDENNASEPAALTVVVRTASTLTTTPTVPTGTATFTTTVTFTRTAGPTVITPTATATATVGGGLCCAQIHLWRACVAARLSK